MSYEFTSTEDSIIDGVGLRGLIIGVLLMAIALADIIRTTPLTMDLNNVLTIIQDILLVVMAIAFVLPFSDYQKIARTAGKDISHLMNGLINMRKGFMIIATCIGITVVTEIIRLVASI